MLESGFSQVQYLFSKHRNTSNIEYSDLWLKLTNLQTNIRDLFSVH